MAGVSVLVTAGGTREPIDPVRGLTNRSSGKQGYAIAAALARLGARVTLVSGPVALECPRGVDRVFIETAVRAQCRAQRCARIAASPVNPWSLAIWTACAYRVSASGVPASAAHSASRLSVSDFTPALVAP